MFEQLLSVLATGPSGAVESSDAADTRGETPERGEPALDVTVTPEAVRTEAVEGVRSSLHEEHASGLETVVGDGSARRPADAAQVADSYAKEGASAGEFVTTYRGALDALVDEAFDLVRDGQIDEAERALRDGLDGVVTDVSSGVDRYDELESGDEYADAVLGIEELLESIPFPIYVLDAETRVIGWNYGHTALVGMSREEAIGKTARESVIKATYSEGARKKTLAEKVIEYPRRADEEYDIGRDDTPYSDQTVYYDTSTATNLDDEEIEIEFWAVPIFEDGELVAVFEMLNDRTEEVRRQEGLERLVTEVTETLKQIGAGNLTARAEFDDGAVDNELQAIVGEVNEMAAEFQSLVEDVNAKTGELAESIRETADDAGQVDEELTEQTDSLEQAAEEMENFSAAMEEIASTSNEVATAAKRARDEVEDGMAAANDARSVAGEVSDASDELVDTVEQLADRMEEIEEVVEVIDDIADQTNMLALNANIEAARAGEDGEGFAVVANEIKDLADETQAYTEQIAGHIEEIEHRADETATAVETSHDRVEEVDEEIRRTVDAFEGIGDAVDSAADGIEEVADANDTQAARVEEVLSIVESAQEDAQRVSASADEIVTETETQREAVGDLESQIESLTE